jgi:hypothetical protein
LLFQIQLVPLQHDRAAARLDQLDAAFVVMKRAEEALLEEEEEEAQAERVKLHH